MIELNRVLTVVDNLKLTDKEAATITHDFLKQVILGGALVNSKGLLEYCDFSWNSLKHSLPTKEQELASELLGHIKARMKV